MDNFDIYSWNKNRFLKEGVADTISKQDKMVEAVASAISKNFDIPKDGYLTGTIRVALADFIEENITEGWNDKIEKIGISYVSNGQLYSISVNGEKQRGEDFDNIKKLIQDATQIDISDDRHIDKVVDFMKGLGIEVTVFEMDVS